jgi:hypothetical protein
MPVYTQNESAKEEAAEFWRMLRLHGGTRQPTKAVENAHFEYEDGWGHVFRVTVQERIGRKKRIKEGG